MRQRICELPVVRHYQQPCSIVVEPADRKQSLRDISHEIRNCRPFPVILHRSDVPERLVHCDIHILVRRADDAAVDLDDITLADLRARLLYNDAIYPDVPVRHEIVRLSPAAYPCRRYIFIDPHYALHKAMLQRLLHFVINFNT